MRRSHPAKFIERFREQIEQQPQPFLVLDDATGQEIQGIDILRQDFGEKIARKNAGGFIDRK